MDRWKMKKWEKSHRSNERPVTHNDLKIFIPFSVLVYCLCSWFGFAPHNFACKLFLCLDIVHSVPVFRIVICFFSVRFFSTLTHIHMHNHIFLCTRPCYIWETKHGCRNKTSYDLTTEWDNFTNGVYVAKRQRWKRKIMSVANFYSCKFLSLLDEVAWHTQKNRRRDQQQERKVEIKCNGNYRKWH